MPIQTFHEDFLGFKIESCNVDQGGLYIMRFNPDCHKREFVSYGSVVGGVDVRDEGTLIQTAATCMNFIGDYVQAQLVGGCVNITFSQPTCYPAPLSFDPLTNTLFTNEGEPCESSVNLSMLMGLMIDVTYLEIQTLINDGDLIPGMKYKITDYQSTMAIGNTNVEYMTGVVEELVVTATSTTTISNEVKSMQYPQDDIWYDVNDNSINRAISASMSTSAYPIVATGPAVFTIQLDDDISSFSSIRIYDSLLTFDIILGLGIGFTVVDLVPGTYLYEITLTGYTGDLTIATIYQNWTGTDTLTVSSPLIFTLQLQGAFIMDNNFYLEIEDGNGNGLYVDYSQYGVDWDYTLIGPNLYQIAISEPTFVAAGGDLTTINSLSSGYINMGGEYTYLTKTGTIYNRKDTEKNIETNYDFRTAVSRIREMDITGKAYNPTTAYVKNDWMLYTDGYIYLCMVDNTGVAPAWTEYYRVRQFYYTPGSFILPYQYGLQFGRVGVTATANYQDMPVFSDTSYGYYDANVKDFRNTLPNGNRNYPVFFQSNVKNVTFDNYTGSFTNMTSLSNVRIDKGEKNIFSSNIIDVNITEIYGTYLSGINKLSANYITASCLGDCTDIRISSVNKLNTYQLQVADIGFMFNVAIGTLFNSNKNLVVNRMSDTTILGQEDCQFNGTVYDCVFGQMGRVIISGEFYNYVQTLPSSTMGLSNCHFKGMCANNIVSNSMTSTEITTFIWNEIGCAITGMNVTVGFQQNKFLGTNGMAIYGCNFGSVANIGAVEPTAISLSTCDIGQFYSSGLTTGATQAYIHNVTANIIADLRLGQLSRLQNVAIENIDRLTIAPGIQLSYSTIQSFVNCTVNNTFQYNDGGSFEDCVFDGAYIKNHTIGRMQTETIPITALKAGDNYSAEVMQANNMSWYISWLDSLTGYNYGPLSTS